MPTVLVSRGTPGYELFTDSAGPAIPVVAVYQNLYLLCTASAPASDISPGEFVVVGSMDDFTNQFGSSDAVVLDSIECYLANNPTGLYVAYVDPAAYCNVTVVADATPAAKEITLNTFTIGYTVDASPTLQEVITGLVTAINDDERVNLNLEAEYILNSDGTINYAGGQFRIRDKSGAGFTATGSTDVTVGSITTPSDPAYWDWMGALRKLKELYEDEPLGFLACPQAFMNLTNQYERTQVGNTMEEVARHLGWFAYIDPGNPSTISAPRLAKDDAEDYAASYGHSAYTYPYFLNRDLDKVAPSVAIPAVALRRYQRQGIQQPPAGVDCLIDGLSGVEYKLNNAQKVDLADNYININVYQPGVGTMPFDTLTRSTNAAFLMINTRVIMSSFERTLRNTLRSSKLLFQAVDGAGRYYSRLRLTVAGVADLFYRAGCLYGATPGEAYQVLCDAAMQDEANLEAGIVVFEAYLVPVPISRRIRGFVYRVAINQLTQTVAIESAIAAI